MELFWVAVESIHSIVCAGGEGERARDRNAISVAHTIQAGCLLRLHCSALQWSAGMSVSHRSTHSRAEPSTTLADSRFRPIAIFLSCAYLNAYRRPNLSVPLSIRLSLSLPPSPSLSPSLFSCLSDYFLTRISSLFLLFGTLSHPLSSLLLRSSPSSSPMPSPLLWAGGLGG